MAKRATAALRAAPTGAGVRSPANEAAVLLRYAMAANRLPGGPPPPPLWRRRRRGGAEELDRAAQALFEDGVERRVRGEPLAQIVGEKEFFRSTFSTPPGVLVPRPETEHVVETVLDFLRLTRPQTSPDPSDAPELFSDPQNAPIVLELAREALRSGPSASGDRSVRLLDLGTGSGCILLSLLLELAPAASGMGLDISRDALRVAADNARRLGLLGASHSETGARGDRLELVQSSWLTELNKLDGMFTVVTANPPYLSAREWETSGDLGIRYDPKIALVGGDSGLEAYHEIFESLRGRQEVIAESALVALEVGEGQAEAVADCFRPLALQKPSIIRDLAGIPRVVAFLFHQ
jgi:release factor glutamine methyltransferase